MSSRFVMCDKNRKGSSLRNDPQFSLWIWCLVVYCLGCLPCIYSRDCLGVNISVALYPGSSIFVPHGQPLELFCEAVNHDADNLIFRVGPKVLQSERYNATTRRLYIEKPERQLETYSCYNEVTKKSCVSRVLVDTPPERISDFKCISYNFDVLNCSWTSPEKFSITNYSLTIITAVNRMTPCIASSGSGSSKIRFCEWYANKNEITGNYRQTEQQFNFLLKACNYFNCTYQNFTVNHTAIVKPDPPSDLKVITKDSHSVTLQWNIPNNIFDFLRCGVDHKIEYQIAKIDNKAFFHRVDVSKLPTKNKTYKFQLQHLPYAHMQYEVRIYIKSNQANDLWSGFSYKVFVTASERPSRPPDMIAGAFHQSRFNNKRIVYIYWKQLEEYEEAGANFTYYVLVTQNNTTTPFKPDKNKSLSYVTLDNASLDAMYVSVWSENANGTSENSSHLYIPPEAETNSLSLTSFTKLAYENGTYELSWRGIYNIDNYTLFWCQHNSTKICVGQMNFTVLSPNKNRHVIDLPNDYRYQFAISANKGTVTSGMVWASCDISKDAIKMYNFPMKLEHDTPGKSFVKIRWTMDCALQDGVITGYNITYCPVVLTSSFCDDAYSNLYKYVDDPNQMDVNITDLLPFRTYQFTIALNTTHGLKIIANTSTELTTTEDTPTSPHSLSYANVKYNSIELSWEPPKQRNGNIGKYVIYNYGKEFDTDKLSGAGDDKHRRTKKLTGLNGYTNYSLTVQACNSAIGLCSELNPNETVVVQTKIGPPGTMKAPTFENNPDILKWEPPEIHGGALNVYQIMRIKDDNPPEIMNTTNLSYSLIYCEGVVSVETYQVRAVNYDESNNNFKKSHDYVQEFPGEWSEKSSVNCRGRDGLTTILVFAVIILLMGMIYGCVKWYKNRRKMEDIIPDFPEGLGMPEKDLSKYAFSGWNQSIKDEKPSSDEMLLLPNSKIVVAPPEIKQQDDNCAASDHTDSTALSDSSRGPVDKQPSTSDDGSDTSLHLEADPIQNDVSNRDLNEDDTASNSGSESSCESSPYFSDKALKRNPISGYVQQPIKNPTSGYVQSAPEPVKVQPQPTQNALQPGGSSYVMAALAPPIFTTGIMSPSTTGPANSGYVRPDDVHSRTTFPDMGQAPPKEYGPESLPIMPTLPPPMKHGVDSSYIQLQSLDSLPSVKPIIRNSVPLKSVSSGYVSPGDAVINKHLNILSAGQAPEEAAILDPAMSLDAYCRFSWNTDPAKDNLHTLLADSPTRHSKN